MWASILFSLSWKNHQVNFTIEFLFLLNSVRMFRNKPAICSVNDCGTLITNEGVNDTETRIVI